MKFRISGFLGFRGFSGSEVWEFSFWGYLWTVGLWRKVGLRAWETAATVETDYERPERRGKPLHPRSQARATPLFKKLPTGF